jgi:AcrR family transcriptional regulator
MRLFAEKGYQSTSVADILSAAEANAGSLYHAFPTKQDVLIAVLEAYRDGIGTMLLEPAWGAIGDPVEQIFALLAAYRQMLVETDCQYGCPIGSLALELHEPDPPVRALLAANFDGWTAAVRSRVEAAGERLAAADPTQLATFVLTIMEGAVMQARTHRSIVTYDACVASLRDYFRRLEEETSC